MQLIISGRNEREKRDRVRERRRKVESRDFRDRYPIKIWEVLEIRWHDCGPGKGLNQDKGCFIRTDIWDPVLSSM